MNESNWSELELRADAATKLPSFPINLADVRNNVELLLTQVGRYGFFNEYTDHSFRHVESMIKTAEWLIPADSKDQLSAGECLLLVLGIYFHDVGMLISRHEYNRRNDNVDFTKFRNEPIISANQLDEFRARLNQLPDEEAERIWFQEYVRYSHGRRIRSWIEGLPTDAGDESGEIRQLVSSLFAKFDPALKRDLALLCESHTRDDLADVQRYKVSQPYGSSEEETVNLQYLAAVLRTVDLLQITKNRAPSILYQLINPTDPLSQVEWRKQGAVRNVRPKPGLDRDGNVSPDAQADTIEVHAQFQHADGFFGLTSYLTYAEREIQSCYAAIAKSLTKTTRPLKYPWRYIDQSNIEATGFLTESFGFTLDQQKILDLLTGHTLYNDTTVVLRELTQNALDAVRLQQASEPSGTTYEPSIRIKWASQPRTLTIEDNGTGMSQEVIVNHLLKVGSSRYQDPQFKERHPDFSSISRFGIGVLTAFMVSDDVEITTCSPEDEKARRVSLRSVHGKYLIKLLDKEVDRDEIGVVPHGTSVRLVIRPTAAIRDIMEIARLWLMFPRCAVTVQVDDNAPQPVGYSSPKEAIESYLATTSAASSRFRREVAVHEVSQDGVTLAFALARSRYFKDWSFVEVGNEARLPDGRERPPMATCIEGVGVEFSTPGFRGGSIVAIANAVGKDAPKTNVARSALEDTAEQRRMLETIYRLYAGHVSTEIQRLQTEEGFSLTRAVGEAPYIASALLGREETVIRAAALEAAMAESALLLGESDDGRRRRVSLRDLQQATEFWTVESPLSRSAEQFVRDAPTNISAQSMLKMLGNVDSPYPPGLTLLNYSASHYLTRILYREFEVTEIVASEKSRRVDARWRCKGEKGRWIDFEVALNALESIDRRLANILVQVRHASRRARQDVKIPVGDVSATGLGDASGVLVNRDWYFQPEDPLTKFLGSLWTGAQEAAEHRKLVIYFILLETLLSARLRWQSVDEDSIRRQVEPGVFNMLSPHLTDIDDFIFATRSSSGDFFDPFAWDRKEQQ
ncbi:HD domain-containing protein [Coralloluteibacterium stylophorae]|uniref:ATP-binding protein n=2 Tax=Coralloluteibacterium stylophorae TaxID=1776034 RepID=A0AAP2G031_9GAMM|nr:ATP-binding protein [Coralloluteibacterium stylophorae]MBS7457365.1 ATP-binding protein [Coralloluteibacterium stylophorae]